MRKFINILLKVSKLSRDMPQSLGAHLYITVMSPLSSILKDHILWSFVVGFLQSRDEEHHSNIITHHANLHLIHVSTFILSICGL
jgi:hypothetical protein